jgi:predicted transcriptional regulator
MLAPIFFKEKPLRTLVCLAKKDRVWYASMVCKEIDCTYPHMINIINLFEDEGLVATEDQGRIRIIRLTPKGEDLAHDLENVVRRMDRQKKGE